MSHLLYLDTSALIRLYSDEPHRDAVLTEQAASGGVVAHAITYVELRAGLAGRLRRKLMKSRDYRTAKAAFETDWPTFAHVEINPLLLTQAGDLAEAHALRAYDAVHLAAALGVLPLGLVFMTFDEQLREVAARVMPGAVWLPPA